MKKHIKYFYLFLASIVFSNSIFADGERYEIETGIDNVKCTITNFLNPPEKPFEKFILPTSFPELCNFYEKYSLFVMETKFEENSLETNLNNIKNEENTKEISLLSFGHNEAIKEKPTYNDSKKLNGLRKYINERIGTMFFPNLEERIINTHIIKYLLGIDKKLDEKDNFKAIKMLNETTTLNKKTKTIYQMVFVKKTEINNFLNFIKNNINKYLIPIEINILIDKMIKVEEVIEILKFHSLLKLIELIETE